jgi:hypothetical protein
LASASHHRRNYTFLGSHLRLVELKRVKFTFPGVGMCIASSYTYRFFIGS